MANLIKGIKAIKKIKPTGVKGRGTKSISVKEPKSNVKVIKKSGLENRGNKLSTSKKIKRNQAYVNDKRFNRMELQYEQSLMSFPQGPGSAYGGSRGLSIKKENRERSVFPGMSKLNKKGNPLTKKKTIKINSNIPKKRGN